MKSLQVVACSLLIIVCIAVMASFVTPSDDGVPVGTVMIWAGEKNTVPPGWKVCNGRKLGVKEYPELFAAIGGAWGRPSAGKFRLPDLRGRFIRGVDDGSGWDPDADDRELTAEGGNSTGVGTTQMDSMRQHSHGQTAHSHQYLRYTSHGSLFGGGDQWGPRGYPVYTDTNTAQPQITGVVSYPGGSKINCSEYETRPRNSYVYFIIKVK